MSETARRGVLYGVAVLLAGGVLFATYGIERKPDPGTRLNGAALVAQLGDYERALAMVEETLQEHPDHPDALVYKAAFLALAGRSEEAIAAYDRAIEKNSDAATRRNLRVDRASVCLEAGREKEFAVERERLATEARDYRVHLLDGLWYRKKAKWEEAAEAFRRASEAQPEDASVKGRLYEALMELGRACLESGDFDAARNAFDAARDAVPGALEGHLKAIEVRIVSGDLDAAVALLRRVRAEAPGLPALWFRAATGLLEEGERDRAIEAIVIAAKIDATGTHARLLAEAAWVPVYRSETRLRELFPEKSEAARLTGSK